MLILKNLEMIYHSYITGEMSHRMGMDAVRAFRFACSSAINPIEHWVMETLFPGGNNTSITIGLGEELLNGQTPEFL